MASYIQHSSFLRNNNRARELFLTTSNSPNNPLSNQAFKNIFLVNILCKISLYCKLRFGVQNLFCLKLNNDKNIYFSKTGYIPSLPLSLNLRQSQIYK